MGSSATSPRLDLIESAAGPVTSVNPATPNASQFVSDPEVGLRLPLSLPVRLILDGLDICPMQLSPNSIHNILIFVIVMMYLDLEPSFDNFWSLFSFTAFKRSGEHSFFYLTARPKCRFTDRLPSNVGTWKEQFLFIRPPPGQEWPFRCSWRESKPRPVSVEMGLERDLISSLTHYWYKASVLLKEEVLKLVDLSPAPLRVRGTLDKAVMNARGASKMRARRAPPAFAAPSQTKTSTNPADDASQQVSQPTGLNQPAPIIEVPSESTRGEVTPKVALEGKIAPLSTDEVADMVAPDADVPTPALDVAKGSLDPQKRKRKHKHKGKDKSSSRFSKRNRRSKGHSEGRRKVRLLLNKQRKKRI